MSEATSSPKPVDKAHVEAAWYAVTGVTQMDFIVHEGKVYIPISTVLRAIMSFRTSLVRMGMHKQRFMTSGQVMEMFGYLTRKLANLYKFRQFKKYSTQRHGQPQEVSSQDQDGKGERILTNAASRLYGKPPIQQ